MGKLTVSHPRFSGTGSVLIPADRSGIQIDIDLLDLLILFQSVYAQLTADAAHLITAPRCLCKAGIVAVHPGDTGSQLFDHTHRA